MKLRIHNPTGEPIPEPVPFDLLSESEQALVQVFRGSGLDIGKACEYLIIGARGGFDRQPTAASVPFKGKAEPADD